VPIPIYTLASDGVNTSSASNTLGYSRGSICTAALKPACTLSISSNRAQAPWVGTGPGISQGVLAEDILTVEAGAF